MNSSPSIFTRPADFKSQPQSLSESPNNKGPSRRASISNPSSTSGEPYVHVSERGVINPWNPEHEIANPATETLPNGQLASDEAVESLYSPINRQRSLCSSGVVRTDTTHPLPSQSSAQKRRLPLEASSHIARRSERQAKKSRIHYRPRHTLDPSTFPKGPLVDDSPASPLFFSNSSRARPAIPPRLSSSEAGATMINNTRTEEGSGIRTIRMARGTLSTSNSPSRTVTSPPGRLPLDRPTMSEILTPEENRPSSNLQALSQIGIVEFLEQDDRPTFILDMGTQANFQPGPLQIMFANAALMDHGDLYNSVCGRTVGKSPGLAATDTFAEFKAWAVSFVDNNESMDVCLPSFLFADITWTCSTLRKRFRLINGSLPLASAIVNSNPPSSGPTVPSSLSNAFLNAQPRAEVDDIHAAPEEPNDYFGNAQFSLPEAGHGETGSTTSNNIAPVTPMTFAGSSKPAAPLNNVSRLAHDLEDRQYSPLENPSKDLASRLSTANHSDTQSSAQRNDQGFFDWTRLPVSTALPRHIQFARSVDWASTSLGPIEGWSSILRGMCNLIMASPNPSAMYFGHDYTAIYNEAYIHLAGRKHPHLMGLPYSKAWPEIWSVIEPVFSTATLTGQSTMKDDDCLFLNRSGFLEETYFSWLSPPSVERSA